MKNIPKTDPLIPRKDARALLGGIAKGTMQNWEKEGRLPPPIRLSARVIGWRKSVLEAVLERAAVEGGAT